MAIRLHKRPRFVKEQDLRAARRKRQPRRRAPRHPVLWRPAVRRSGPQRQLRSICCRELYAQRRDAALSSVCRQKLERGIHIHVGRLDFPLRSRIESCGGRTRQHASGDIRRVPRREPHWIQRRSRIVRGWALLFGGLVCAWGRPHRQTRLRVHAEQPKSCSNIGASCLDSAHASTDRIKTRSDQPILHLRNKHIP